MPPKHGVGLDDGERLAGLRTQGTGPSENHPVDDYKWHPTGPIPSEHNDLLSQHKISASNAARDRHRSMTTSNTIRQKSNMAGEHHTILPSMPTGWNLR